MHLKFKIVDSQAYLDIYSYFIFILKIFALSVQTYILLKITLQL